MLNEHQIDYIHQLIKLIFKRTDFQLNKIENFIAILKITFIVF